MSRKERQSGEERFEQYYSDLYGERWPRLRQALLSPNQSVSLSDRLLTPYYMDKASILAAEILPISENNKVLDMCAAPGGKTLSIALRLNGTGLLVSNDRSASRRNRLINVLDTHLEPKLRSVVKVTGHDSTQWSLHEKDAYDRILLDAPCSSERHVLNDASELYFRVGLGLLGPEEFRETFSVVKQMPDSRGYVLSLCCKPLPGDPVIGFKADDGTVIVHKKACPEVEKLALEYGSSRFVVVKNFESEFEEFPVRLSIRGIDKRGLLSKISQFISLTMEINIREIHLGGKDGVMEGYIEMLVHDKNNLEAMIRGLSQIDGIQDVVRTDI